MRTVWLVNHYALPPGGSGGTRHYTLAKELGKLGWRPIVIAASTEANTGKQRLKMGESSRRETIDGVDFLWLRTPSYKGNGIGRLFNMVHFGLRLATLSRRALPKPDVMLISSPQPFADIGAWSQAARYGVPFVYELRDLWPNSLVELGRISARHPLIVLFGAIRRFLLKRCAAAVVLMPGAAACLGAEIAREKIVWIPNGIDATLFAGAMPPPAREDFTYMIFGSFNTANGMDNVLRAMQIVESRAPQLRLRLIGEGPLKKDIEALAQTLGLRRVQFGDGVAKQQIPAIAAEADAFVFNVKPAPVYAKYGISANKLFEFMAAARPVIFACEAVNDPVKEADAGISVAPDDPSALAEAMLALAALPLEERQAMSMRGRAYALAHNDFAALAAKLGDTLAAAMAGKSA